VALGPTSTRDFTPGKNNSFTLASWLLPKEAIAGRPLSWPIKGRGWPSGMVEGWTGETQR
jgi:hypothetical protein